jgi:tRNA(Ile)-lysidine synthase
VTPDPSLPGGLRRAFADPRAPAPGTALVVAVSGGRDSVVLLHLLRFAPDLPDHRLVAAHLDHAMRPCSRGDADWVRGLCRAWGIPLRARRLGDPPADEAGARRARYAFLEEVRAGEGAAAALTAHHADDQAETILHRAARGTGLRGLGGILPHRAPGIWRPLLEATSEELADYAGSAGLAWREDPTNLGPGPRNVLRHEILPRLEEAVAPGARAALAGLARRAREAEAAWEEALPGLLEPLRVRGERGGEVSFLRAPLLQVSDALGLRLLRALARRAGVALDDPGTRSAWAFVVRGASGRAARLPGGLELRRELDRMAFRRPRPVEPDRELVVEGAGRGEGRVVLGGRRWRLAWGARRRETGYRATFAVGGLWFPLRVRGRAPGDRIRLEYGSKKLTKLFLEARVPLHRRPTLPVVVDGAGEVLWVPGLARSVLARPGRDSTLLHMECIDADTD